MDNSFKSLIDSATSIAIVLPTKPYLDQVAAALALYVSLKPTKDITVTSPTPPTVEFSRLIGVDKISAELGNKNLVITFPNYQATNIERVSYDIEEGQFKLSVIPKQGFESPTSEQTKFEYAGGKADLILLIGGANESHYLCFSCYFNNSSLNNFVKLLKQFINYSISRNFYVIHICKFRN